MDILERDDARDRVETAGPRLLRGAKGRRFPLDRNPVVSQARRLRNQHRRGRPLRQDEEDHVPRGAKPRREEKAGHPAGDAVPVELEPLAGRLEKGGYGAQPAPFRPPAGRRATTLAQGTR